MQLHLSLLALAGPALVLSCAAPAQDSATRDATSFLGVWERQADGTTLYLSLAPERTVLDDPEQGREYHLSRFGPSGLWTYFYGQALLHPLSLDGDTLTFDGEVYTRSSVDPTTLEVAPVRLAEPTELDPDDRQALLDDLMARRQRDQEIRSRLGEEWDGEVVSEMLAIDRENTAWISELVGRVGWIDAPRFGPEASRAAFLIVQHSGDAALMLAARPHLQAEFEAGQIRGASYALLHDRLELMLGRPQVYGSQMQSSTDPDGTEHDALAPLTERAGVDERRAAMGMEPLLDYLAYFELTEVPYFEWPE